MTRSPTAFLSYVRSDDDHDAGRITELRQRLEGEVRIQTGLTFSIFQDRNDIQWGQTWKERIDNAIMNVKFLIPIITPSFFKSEMCRKEFESFLIREATLGENSLILPIYYIAANELRAEYPLGIDHIADVLRSRHWVDWRELRFAAITSPKIRAAVAKLATQIASSGDRLSGVIETADRKAAVSSHEIPSPPRTVGGTHPSANTKPSKSYPYKVYTKEFDEIIEPYELADAAEVRRLYRYLAKKINDSAIIDDPFGDYSLPLQVVSLGKSVCITLLVDCSGSMRGSKILAITIWTTLLGRILNKAGLQFEVLGFTTRAWKGGRSREKWLSDGKPPNPGRLNDLRHVVFKGFDDPYEQSEPSISLLLREGLLKENIDGEALLWAFDRISKRDADRRLIFIISDGAPVDDSTLSVNPSNILEGTCEIRSV